MRCGELHYQKVFKRTVSSYKVVALGVAAWFRVHVLPGFGSTHCPLSGFAVYHPVFGCGHEPPPPTQLWSTTRFRVSDSGFRVVPACERAR